jgi:hypothetical protein
MINLGQAIRIGMNGSIPNTFYNTSVYHELIKGIDSNEIWTISELIEQVLNG